MLFHFPKNKKQIGHGTREADCPTKPPPFVPFPDI